MTSRSTSTRSTRIRGPSSSRSNDHLHGPESRSSTSVAGTSKIKATRVPVMAAASGKTGIRASSSAKGPVLNEVTNRGHRSTHSTTGSHGHQNDLDKPFKAAGTAGTAATGKTRATRLTSSSSHPDNIVNARSRGGMDGVKEAAARMNAAVEAGESSSATNARSTRLGHRHHASTSSISTTSSAPPAKRIAIRSGKSSVTTAKRQAASMDVDQAAQASSSTETDNDDALSVATTSDALMDEDEQQRLAELEALDQDDQQINAGDSTVTDARRKAAATADADRNDEDMSDDEEEEEESVFGEDQQPHRASRSRMASGATTERSSSVSTANTTPWLEQKEQFAYDEATEDAILAKELDPDCLLRLTPDLEEAAQQKKAHIMSKYYEEVIKPGLAAARAERAQAHARGEISPEVWADEDELAIMGLDLEEVRDTTMVAEYADDIFGYMAECERNTMPNPNYMAFQTEIQWYMRGTLVDWLLQVHVRYHMLPETLWIAINIIDRFLSVRVVALQKLQLVGVTSMFIAAKYEEIIAPSVDEFVFMTESGYSKEEILKGERIILSTLNFNISTYCTPYSWVRRISKADDYDVQTRTLSKFLMEVTLLDHRFLRARPSLIAAMSMFLAKKMLNGEWTDAFVYYSNFTEEQLVPGANLVLEKLIDPAFEDQFVCKKYANKKFLKASLYARDWAQQNHRSIAAAAEAAAPSGTEAA